MDQEKKMEVSGRKGAMSMADSISSSSAEDYSISCQPCLFEGNNLAAEGYCQTCNEYLCKTCLGVHRKQSATRNHIILGQDQMPKKQSKSQDICSKPCNIHIQEIVKFYCKSHDVVGCGDCMVLDHKHCKVELVANISGMLDKEKSEIRKQIQEFEKELEKTKLTLQSTDHDIVEKYSNVSKDIQAFRKQVNQYLDEMEAKLVSEANKGKKEAETAIKDLSKELQTMTSDLDNLFQEIDRKTDECNNLFVSLKQAKEKLSYMKLSHARLSNKSSKIQLVDFERNETVNRLLLDNISLGGLKMLPVQRCQVLKATSPSQKKESIMEMTASYAGKIVVKSRASELEPKISGMAMLSADELVVVDNRQKNVRLITLQNNEIRHTLSLKSPPFDITRTEENRAAITVPGKYLVKFISARNGVLRQENDITVNGECYGISHYPGGFVVSFLRPGKVEMIDMDGNVLKSIVSDANGQDLFIFPQYVDICPSSQVIYVSDSHKQEMITVTPEGKTVGLYKESIWPQGLFALDDGKCLVAMYVTDINVVSSECNKLKTIVRTNGELKWMWAICYSYEHKKIFVSCENGRHINVYQLQ